MMIQKIASLVGKVEEIDTGEGGNCLGQYARARITRDVNTLQRCVRVQAGDKDEMQIILIRYERLPEFCSACGRVGHNVRHCLDVSADKTQKPFGIWLKATRTLDYRRGRGGGGPKVGSSVSGSSSSAVPEVNEFLAAGENISRAEDVASALDLMEVLGSSGRLDNQPHEMVLPISAGLERKVTDGNNDVFKQVGETLSTKKYDASPREFFHDRAKNLPISASPIKKSKNCWKRRARSKGKDKGAGDAKEMLAGDKRKGETFPTEEAQSCPKRPCPVDVEIGHEFPATVSTAVAASQPRRSL